MLSTQKLHYGDASKARIVPFIIKIEDFEFYGRDALNGAFKFI